LFIVLEGSMDAVTREHFHNIASDDREQQNAAFMHLISVTDEPVAWSYDIWDDLVAMLAHPGNRVRAIASQVLCNLAKSDPDERMLEDLDALLEVIRDERFVTARHSLQSLWKVGVAGEKQRHLLLNGLDRRYQECLAERNATLIRYDILETLKKIYDQTGDEGIREKALEWIATEADPKYRKKYARLWSPAKKRP
jgi:hypothetical protein